MRRAARAWPTRGRAWLLGAALAASPLACGDPELGELPARCPDGACPTGYTCIHEVCARPGTAVPITVADTSFLRGGDLRVLPQTTTALVVWQTYAYSDEGEGFVGVRVAPDGTVSPRMPLVTDFVADPGVAEPSYDVLRANASTLLLAVSANPVQEETKIEPRLAAYRVRLPAEGAEAEGATFDHVWRAEQRMPSVGYGAASGPRLVATPGAVVSLGYVQSRTEVGVTLAELAIFGIDPGFDVPTDPDPPLIYPVRAGLPVAVDVAAAFEVPNAVWWVLDRVRPSALYVPGGVLLPEELPLERLGVGLTATPSSLTYLRPSARAGEKLATDPVTGPAELHRLDTGGAMPADHALGTLVPVRDSPPPVWVGRLNKPGLLITPGADLDAGEIGVYVTDAATGKSASATFVPRLSSRPIAAVGAVVVAGKLFVVWAEQGPTSVAIRMAILDEP